jgi:hypothetical protein
MQDAVSLIGKKITIKETNYEITSVHFVPQAVSPKHYYYFGCFNPKNKCTVNYSYEEILPYLVEQIKL